MTDVPTIHPQSLDAGLVQTDHAPMVSLRAIGERGFVARGDTKTQRLWWFATGCLAVLVLAEAVWLALAFIGPDPGWDFGQDYVFYRNVGREWLASGQFYLPRQLEGPYVVELMVDVLYPPSALFLFVPFAVLPAFLWWAIPIAVTGYVLWKLNPAPWAIVVMLILLAFPRAIGAYLFGNTDIWAVAGVAAGIRWGWPAVLLFIKPTFAPFALVGVRRRSWWLGLGVMALSVLWLPLTPLWLDYYDAMRNVTINGDYSLGSVPLLLIPIVGWLGSHAHAPHAEWDTDQISGSAKTPARVLP